MLARFFVDRAAYFDVFTVGLIEDPVTYAGWNVVMALLGQLKEMIQSEDGLVSLSRELFYDDKTICFAVNGVRKRNMTLQAVSYAWTEIVKLC